MISSAILVVVFDIGGVLVSEEPVPPHLEGVLDRHDPDDRLATGHFDERWMRSTFRDELGLSEPEADRFMVELWDWYCGTLDLPLFEWALGLKERVRVAMLSNSADGARREEEARYGFSTHFSPIVYSHEVGLAKPDERIYLHLCDILEVAPSEVVFIDDRPPNVAAAARLGMNAVHHTAAVTTIAIVERLLAPRVQS